MLDCLIQLCILKLACQKRNILFDHRDFLPKNILVKQAATQAVLLPPGADSHDRSYNTSYVFLMTDFDSTCVRKLHSDANSRARAAVSESTVNESTILIVVDECTDSEEAGFFMPKISGRLSAGFFMLVLVSVATTTCVIRSMQTIESALSSDPCVAYW